MYSFLWLASFESLRFLNDRNKNIDLGSTDLLFVLLIFASFARKFWNSGLFSDASFSRESILCKYTIICNEILERWIIVNDKTNHLDIKLDISVWQLNKRFSISLIRWFGFIKGLFWTLTLTMDLSNNLQHSIHFFTCTSGIGWKSLWRYRFEYPIQK